MRISVDSISLPGLNLMDRPGGIGTSCPVRGLRPIPRFLGRTINTPNPRISIRWDLSSASLNDSMTASVAISARTRVRSAAKAT